MKVIIIGAGAAGCFAAIHIKRQRPDAEVTVFESASRPLAKVAITGGGRCNLTNTFAEVDHLAAVYPRGDKLLRRALSTFSHQDTWQWFEQEGVPLVAQDDQCVFPQSQDAMQIVNTLTALMRKHGITLLTRHKVRSISHEDDGYHITFADQQCQPVIADRILVTAGGQPRAKGFDMLAPLNLRIEAPVPSLFTFNLSGHWHTGLMGCVVEHTTVTLASTKHKAAGPLLLTHWGMSGPAILRLSSYAARLLAERDYQGKLVVNWLDGATDDEARQMLQNISACHSKKLITTTPPQGLTARFWQALLERYSIISPSEGTLIPRWAELGKKQLSRIVTALTADIHEITDRCAFKEEFVTCGGVSLKEINPGTMEARQHPGLFFAGEVIDIDALTGGFNLQAAWSTAFVAAQHIVQE